MEQVKTPGWWENEVDKKITIGSTEEFSQRFTEWTTSLSERL